MALGYWCWSWEKHGVVTCKDLGVIFSQTKNIHEVFRQRQKAWDIENKIENGMSHDEM